MAGRPEKQTVDYFPHDAHPGKTLFILQSRFGNNGYAIWFKVLALLCRTPGHFYDCNKPANWQFLLAEMAFPDGEMDKVLNCLSELEAIDPELWQHRIIWCQNLVNRLGGVYKERKANLPIKPSVNGISPPINSISPPINSQSKVKQSKVKQSKEIAAPNLTDEFLKFKITEYPELNVLEEWKACQLWWSEGKKNIIRPKSALNNWLKIAMQRKSRGDFNATNKTRASSSRDLPQKYTDPEELRQKLLRK